MRRTHIGEPLRNWEDLARTSGYSSEREMLERLYAELPLRVIGERLNCSKVTVLYHLRKHGILSRKRGGLHESNPRHAKRFERERKRNSSMRVDEWRRLNGL
jgi:hypothetical protein